MKIRTRLIVFIVIYVGLIVTSFFIQSRLDNQLSPIIFENPTISVKNYLDDFIQVTISCYWEDKPVKFLVLDDLGNIAHKSETNLSCEGFKSVNLQGMPQDYNYERKYSVQLDFDNKTLRSDYFSLAKEDRLSFVKKELFSSIYFMYYQNRLARGSYSDSQRLLFVDTKDPAYAENYLWIHTLGILSTVTIFLIIDITLWVIYFFSKFVNNKKGFTKRRKK